MPAKRIATSRIGAQEYSFSSRMRLAVVSHESPPPSPAGCASRTRFCISWWTPRTETSPACHTPETMTAARTPARKRKLCHPSMRSGSRGACRGARTAGSSRRQCYASTATYAASVSRATSSISFHERERPEERHAVQEPEEERRVAERRQRAADVGDQKDEEDHGVGNVSPLAVGAEKRPDEQDRRTRGADPGGEDGADDHDRGVDRRRAPQRPANEDPAADREQRADQHDERHVVDDRHVQDRADRRLAIGGDERDHQRQCPRCRDLRVVVVPEARRQKGKSAMESSIPRKGTALHAGSAEPRSTPGCAASAGRASSVSASTPRGTRRTRPEADIPSPSPRLHTGLAEAITTDLGLEALFLWHTQVHVFRASARAVGWAPSLRPPAGR